MSNSTPLSEDIENTLSEILRDLFIKTGIKLTEIGWELADEQMQDAVTELKALLQSQRQALIKEVEEALPEKWHKEEYGQTWFNQAITEMEQALNKLAKGE